MPWLKKGCETTTYGVGWLYDGDFQMVIRILMTHKMGSTNVSLVRRGNRPLLKKKKQVSHLYEGML